MIRREQSEIQRRELAGDEYLRKDHDYLKKIHGNLNYREFPEIGLQTIWNLEN